MTLLVNSGYGLTKPSCPLSRQAVLTYGTGLNQQSQWWHGLRWLGLPVGAARHFVLSTAALSILGYEHTQDEPALRLWNDAHHVVEKPRESLEARGTR